MTMRRSPALLCVVAFMLLGLFAASRISPGAVAQDTTANHPAVGSWYMSAAAFPDAPPALAVFHADGVFTQSQAPGSVAIGTWEATGERSLAATYVLQYYDENGTFIALTVRANGEVAPNGTTIDGTYTAERTDPESTGRGEFGPDRFTAERIAVEAMGTPVGPIEALFEP
jgi:hypothetical protein